MDTSELRLLSELTDLEETTSAEEEDPIENVKKSLAYCFNDEVFAENYVDAIIEVALKEFVEIPNKFILSDFVSPIIDEVLSIAYQTEMGKISGQTCLKNIQTNTFPEKKSVSDTFSGWPKVSDFNIKFGLEKLEEYISSWQKSEEWMTFVEFLGFESEESSSYFIYEVEFSNPNSTYPVPQTTASVYFSLEVPKIIPPPYDAPIQVSYVFESSNVIHIPGRIDFQESWIKDLMQCKLNFFRTLTF